MSTHLFESFSKMIDQMPARGIIAAVELQRRMLADDLAHKRTLLKKEARSVFSFCRFLRAAVLGHSMPPVLLPAPDTAFYRQTTERLIQAGELPATARDQFDAVFSMPLLRSVVDVY